MLTVQSLKTNIIKLDNLIIGQWINFTGGFSNNERYRVTPAINYNPSESYELTFVSYVSYYGDDGFIKTVNTPAGIIESVPNAHTVRLSFNVSGINGIKLIKQPTKYPAQATVNRKQIVNGEQTLSLSFSVSEMNMDFLPDLDFNWLASFDKEDYTIINPSTEAIVKRKSITAILKFFTDFGSMYLQDEVEDKSMTATQAYTQLFSGTGKRVHIIDNFYANTLSYQKNESRLERFHYYNERFKVEFTVSGDDVYLYNKIGSYKPDVRIDEDLNVKSATVEIDSENFFTWCKCYYDLEERDDDAESGEEQKYLQESVYLDSNLYAIYGDKEGPAIYQGNIRNETTMFEYAEDTQRKSMKVSHSVDLIDLQKQGYAEFSFHIGDVIRLSLSSINTTVDIRIVDIDETFVENDFGEWERTNLKLTLGETSKVSSYKSSRNDAFQTLEDWLDGRKRVPIDILSDAIQRASDIINGDTDSVMEYRKDRLIGHHSREEGNRVQMNVSGLEFVRNGVPRSALTYAGLVVDETTTGELNTNMVKVWGAEGFMWMDGDEFVAVNPNDDTQFIRINPKTGLTVSKGALKILSGNGENAVTVWDSAEKNAKLHADTVAGTAESNAKTYADGVGASTRRGLREDLQMTSALPNELELSSNGITAYNNSNDRYARLDYRGLFVEGGAVHIRGKDKRELMIDGQMRGQRVANIIHFNSDPNVIWNNMNWVWKGGTTQRFYFIDDLYQGNLLDLAVATNLQHDSAAASAYVEVRVTTFNGTVVASGRYFVSRSTEGSTFERLRVNLKELYKDVPDYRGIALYIEAQITTNPSATATFRINKGSFYD